MSRSTFINEISSSVTGTFVLHDLLSISTLSGSIDITVVPQPASSSKAPAELLLNTASGSIKVTMAPFLHNPSTVIPDRIFNSSLKSMSGSINAALVHNSKTALSTMSGNIAASLYPLGQPSSMSHVDVRCMSGSTSLILHPYVNSPQASLRTLSTDFRGASGGLEVCFPSTWEGEVMSHLNSGTVTHGWEGLRVLREGPRFTATKGNGLGQLNIWGSAVNVDLVALRVPDLPREVEGKQGGECLSALPREVEVKEEEEKEEERVSDSSVEVEMKEEGERVPVIPSMPNLPREAEVQEERERTPDLPKGEEWQEEEEDDDWTIVKEEDGAQEVTRRPMPTNEELRTR